MLSMASLPSHWGKDNNKPSYCNTQHTTMNLQLIQGQFSRQDALDLLTKMISVKIRFHEDKMAHAATEEDMKMRESRIRQLQSELHEARKQLQRNGETVILQSQIEIL